MHWMTNASYFYAEERTGEKRMQHQFVFTPDDVYRVILAIAGFIVAVAGAVKVVLEAIKKAKEPDEIQNQRITNLEIKVNDIEGNMKRYEKHQKKAEEAWVLYMEALFDLINHTLDGNDVSKLKQTRDKMQRYIAKYSIKEEDGWSDE